MVRSKRTIELDVPRHAFMNGKVVHYSAPAESRSNIVDTHDIHRIHGRHIDPQLNTCIGMPATGGRISRGLWCAVRLLKYLKGSRVLAVDHRALYKIRVPGAQQHIEMTFSRYELADCGLSRQLPA